MREILITGVLLCAVQVACSQTCGVDFETDAPGGTQVSSHSGDSCSREGGPLLQQRLPTPDPRQGFLALHSRGSGFVASEQRGSLFPSSGYARRNHLELLGAPFPEVKNIVPSSLPDSSTVAPLGKTAEARQQILASNTSNLTNGICPSEGRATVKRNSTAEATTVVPDTDKRSRA